MYSYHRLFNAPLYHHCRYWAGLHWYHVSPTQKTRVPHASKIDTSTTILGCLVQLRAGLSAYANNAFTLISLIIVLGFLSFLSRLSRCWTTLGCLEFDSFLYTLFSVFVIRLSPLSFVFSYHCCISAFLFPFPSSPAIFINRFCHFWSWRYFNGTWFESQWPTNVSLIPRFASSSILYLWSVDAYRFFSETWGAWRERKSQHSMHGSSLGICSSVAKSWKIF